MSLSPSAEAPRFHGKTLSPESPRPLHIPEPSSIPVLQNQIDPIFNQMSTHLGPSNSLTTSAAMQNRTPGTAPQETPFSTSVPTAVENGLHGNTSGRDDVMATNHGDDDYAMSFGNEEMEAQQGYSDTSPNHSSIFAVEPPSSMAAYESLSGPTQAESTPLPFGPVFPPFDNAIQHSNNPSEPFQEARGFLPVGHTETALISAAVFDPIHASDGDMNTDEEATAAVNNGGVNYQTLLDNLTPSTATGPSAEHVLSITTDSPTDTANSPTNNNANNPSAALPPAAGLPPRPPPQEKPAIHPNYTPGDDIRSYHLPRTQNTSANPTYTAQSSNSYRPAQGFPHTIIAAGAPGTSSAPNGLPPPPFATFQQPPPNANQAHNSPSTQNFRQRDSVVRVEARSAVTADYDDDDDATWSPEVQKKYDEFLRDERVFVTEGLWDRFPPGSRLFIGNAFGTMSFVWTNTTLTIKQVICLLKRSLSVIYFTSSTNTANLRKYRSNKHMGLSSTLRPAVAIVLYRMSRECQLEEERCVRTSTRNFATLHRLTFA